MILARFNVNDSLDATFSDDGITVSPFGGDILDLVRAIELQPDGKILVAGSAGSSFAVVRYNPDGSLDTSFDQDGIVTTNIFQSNSAQAISIQADGKVVVEVPEASQIRVK